MILDMQKSLQKLRSYENVSFPIMSVYLSIPKNPTNLSIALMKQFHIAFHSAFQEVDMDALKEDLLYIRGYLETVKQRNGYKSIAIFTGGNKVWEVVYSTYAIPSQIYISHSPYLTPLIEHMESSKRYLVILADKSQATFFTLYQGVLENQDHLHDPSVPKIIKGAPMGDRQDKVFRHILDHLHQHLLTVTQYATTFIKQKPIHGVIVGGHKELLNKIKNHLPADLRNKVIGEFVCDITGDMNELTKKSKAVIQTMHQSLSRQVTPTLS